MPKSVMYCLPAAILVGLAQSGMALSQMAAADSVGETEYSTHCATCHGETGEGDGPMASSLTVAVPDLTKLTERNEGTFPFVKVAQIVDGRWGMRAHGLEMPVWGNRFAAEANALDNEGVFLARGRVLSIVYFLEDIQK